MALMLICGLLLLAGAIGAVRWGAESVRPAPVQEREEESPAKLVLRSYLWYVTVAIVAGVTSGVLVAGAGGRLIMRLLAVTAGDPAQGRLTEADEVVGRITTGGTVSFIVFTALFLGGGSGVLYLLVSRWLPRGRLGGLAFGALLLVLAATRVEPLRADNEAFGLVGPGWLAALVFAALVLLHGTVVAALAARYSRSLPLIGRDRRALLGHAPLLVLVPLFPALAAIAVGGGIVVVLARVQSLAASLRSRTALVGGRMVLGAVGLAALPGAVAAFADIV